MQLNNEQRNLVEANMGLVGQVIREKVHGVSRIGIYTYDDLYQIGLIGLCKAAYTNKSDIAKFSTYACVLIRNEIFSALEYSTRRRQREFATDPDELPVPATSETGSVELQIDVARAMRDAETGATGVTAKGIRALRLMSEGYSCREIGELMDAPANHITAWVSRARSYLRSNEALRQLGETT